jgi:hypothetical protein
MRLAAAVLPLLLATPAFLPAEPGAAGPGAAARLAAMLLAETPIVRDLEQLCDRFGGRMTGGAACDRSIDWFAARFREAGADRVWTEEFPVPVRWDEGRSRAVIVSPESIPLSVVAMPFSPPTPGKGLVADVVDLGDGEAERFRDAGGRLRGALGLIDSKILESWEDLFLDYLRVPPIVERARAAGAAGLLFVGARGRGLLYRHVATFSGVAPFPMAILAREDGLRLARLARSGARLRLDLDVRTGPSFTSRNVLAEIRGRERPEEIVLAGAHLDSWELGTGALDNGANCAMLLDVARQMAASGTRARRTVRFALFTGEEQGMYGSLGYARGHRDELDRHAAAVVFDTGTGRITGFSLGGRDDLRPLVEPALGAVAGYDATHHTVDAFVGTDNFDFLLEGVPNLVANQEPANYMENYHASSDTFDKADLREMKIDAAIAAAVVLGLAEAPGRAPRQDRAEIAILLGRTGLADQMKTFGLWDAWEKRARGRAD